MPGIQVPAPCGLHRLIYVSRERLTRGQAEADEIDLIVRDAEARNAEAAVTGLLLAYEGFFLQALEGPGPAVMATFRRIWQDPRHEALRVIISGAADRREFADWPMCARTPAPADAAVLSALGHRDAFDPDRLSGRSSLWLLMAMRRKPVAA